MQPGSNFRNISAGDAQYGARAECPQHFCGHTPSGTTRVPMQQPYIDGSYAAISPAIGHSSMATIAQFAVPAAQYYGGVPLATGFGWCPPQMAPSITPQMHMGGGSGWAPHGSWAPLSTLWPVAQSVQPLHVPMHESFYAQSFACGVEWCPSHLAPVSTQLPVEQLPTATGGSSPALMQPVIDQPVEQPLPAAGGSSPELLQSEIDEPPRCGLQVDIREPIELYDGTLDELCADYSHGLVGLAELNSTHIEHLVASGFSIEEISSPAIEELRSLLREPWPDCTEVAVLDHEESTGDGLSTSCSAASDDADVGSTQALHTASSPGVPVGAVMLQAGEVQQHEGVLGSSLADLMQQIGCGDRDFYSDEAAYIFAQSRVHGFDALTWSQDGLHGCTLPAAIVAALREAVRLQLLDDQPRQSAGFVCSRPDTALLSDGDGEPEWLAAAGEAVGVQPLPVHRAPSPIPQPQRPRQGPQTQRPRQGSSRTRRQIYQMRRRQSDEGQQRRRARRTLYQLRRRRQQSRLGSTTQGVRLAASAAVHQPSRRPCRRRSTTCHRQAARCHSDGAHCGGRGDWCTRMPTYVHPQEAMSRFAVATAVHGISMVMPMTPQEPRQQH